MGLAQEVDPAFDEVSSVLPDAISSVDLARWAAHRLAEAVRIVDDADRRQRRAVWGLLCADQPLAAATMADAIGAPLPDTSRVVAVACGAAEADAVATTVRRVGGPNAWIVQGSGDGTSVVVLLPADDHAPDDDGVARYLASELTDRHPRCRVGASPVVDLARVGAAYAQARHALAAAHVTAGGYARFHAWLEPELLMARHAAAWASEMLAPLVDHQARRRGDPDAAELAETLDVWLAGRRVAHTRLGIHRNTLSGRLRLIQTLLGRDLRRVGDRAELSLALRVSALAGAPAPGAEGEIAAAPTAHRPEDEVDTASRTGSDTANRVPAAAAHPSRRPGPSLTGSRGGTAAGSPPRVHLPLDLPALDGWAYAGLRPLAGGPDGADARTLRVWLANDARLSATADALRLTVPGIRKRLTRIGGVLGLDLLHGPTAEADLWLALRVVDRTDATRLVARHRHAS